MPLQMRTKRPARLKAFDYVGPHRYFLTFCTNRRQRLFVQSAIVECVLTQFRRAADQHAIALIAYCFMPDHVHLLVGGLADNSDGRKFISLAKQLAAFHVARQFGSRLWQHYGYERVLRAEEDTLSVARYVIANPLRARLATSVFEYPFVGSDTHSLLQIVDAVQMMKPG
jgi:putative transposase